MRAEIRAIRVDELMHADEVLITSSSRLASAVVRLDGRPVGDGHAGPVTRRLFAAMRDEIAHAIGLPATERVGA